jgi:hypothetical protein
LALHGRRQSGEESLAKTLLDRASAEEMLFL